MKTSTTLRCVIVLIISIVSTVLTTTCYTKEILIQGETLKGGQSLLSKNSDYELRMQGDGNLVLYQGRRVLWSSRTDRRPGAVCIMQGDGNLVIYLSKKPIWASNTQGNPGSHLEVQNDGNVVIYTPTHQPIWATGVPKPPVANY